MWSVVNKKHDMMQALIAARAQLDVCDREDGGFTSLMRAAYGTRADLVQTLIASKAGLDVRNQRGLTALICAADTGQLENVHILIAAKANLEVRNKEGVTALMLAANQGRVECVQALIKAGAHLETRDNKGNTVLMLALCGHSDTAVPTLVNAGANLEVRNKEGLTALTLAAHRGEVESVQALIKAGAHLENRDSKGNTALMHAIFGGSKTAQALVEAGARTEALDPHNQTALLKAMALEGKASRHENSVTRVLQSRANTKYPVELLRRRFLAHVWGIKGMSTLMHETEGPIVCNLEGLYSQYSLYMLSNYVTKFFKSKNTHKRISIRNQNEICLAFKKVVFRSTVDDHVVQELEAGHPMILAGGCACPNLNPSYFNCTRRTERNVAHHSIVMVIFKNAMNQYRLFVCNRGAGMTQHAIECYAFVQNQITKEIIEKLVQDYPSIPAFKKMIGLSNLKYLYGIKQKPQKIGNCSLASGKAVFRALYSLYASENKAQMTYKEFTYKFVVKKSFRSILNIPKIQMLRCYRR